MAQWSLNTPRLSLSSLKLSVAGVTITGCTVSSIKETVTGDFMFGNGPTAIGIVHATLSGEATLGFIPEEHDNLLQTLAFYAEQPFGFAATLFEPGSGTIYTVSNDVCWMRDVDFDIAREGAVIKSMIKTQGPTSWNGVPALDLAARASDPQSLGALFSGAGLTF